MRWQAENHEEEHGLITKKSMEKTVHIPSWTREGLKASDRGKRHKMYIHLVPVLICPQRMSMCLSELEQESGGLFVNLLILTPSI